MYGDALTTVARIKARLSISSSTFDDLIERMILAVTARIQSACGRRFIQATYTNEVHNGSDVYGSVRKTLILKNGPLQSVTSIQYNAGSNSSPSWTTISADLYDVDLSTGIVYMRTMLPKGYSNIRVTYIGGFSGYSLGISNYWIFNSTPTGTVNGSNLSFTLAETADQVIVYVDGVREAAANVTHTDGTDTFTLAAGRAPYSTIAADYQRTSASNDADYNLPADLVDVCERAVVYLFKTRDAEGRSTETFQESSVTWRQDMFTKEMLATIKNYRRGYDL